MSIQVKLIVDDMEFTLLQHYFGFFQNSDYTGRPTSAPQANTFDGVIEASKDNTFYEWSIHPSQMKKKVEIIFSSRFGTGKSTKITLLDVHCVFCQYHFSSTGDNPFTITFSLSPATIMVDDQLMLSRHWKVTDPALLNQPVTEREEEDKEPRITKQYITDRDDVELKSYERGQHIYCILESEHMDNELVDIDLSSFKVPLLYRGKEVAGNIIKDFTINANEEKIPLQLIPENYEDEQ